MTTPRRVVSLFLLAVGVLALAVPACSATNEFARLEHTREAGLLQSSYSSVRFDGVPSSAAVQEYIHERYGSSSRVKTVRDAIPRFGRSKDFDVKDSDYYWGVINCAIIGGAFIVITLIMWIVWSCIACCCCSPNGKKGEAPPTFTRNQIRIPLVAAVVFSLVVIGFCIAGLLATEEFHKNITGDKGVATITLNTLGHVDSFFGNVNSKMLVVSNNVNSIVPSVRSRLNSFTDLGPGLPGVLSDIRGFGRKANAVNPINVVQQLPWPTGTPPTSADYQCDFCANIQTETDALANSMDSKATPVYNQVDSTKQSALDQVVDAQPQIESSLSDANNQVNQIQDKSTKYNGDINDYKKDVDKYEEKRRAVIIVIFIIPIAISVLFWIFVAGLRKELCSKILIHLMFFSGFVVWIIFLVHLPLAMITADSCFYLDTVDVNLAGRTTLSADITVPLTACLAQQNIITALGVGSDLNFTSSVIFPVVPDVGDLLNATAIADLNSRVQSLTLATFPAYDSTVKQTKLDELNAQTNTAPYTDYFGFNNASQANPNLYTVGNRVDAVGAARSAVVTAVVTEQRLLATLSQLRSNFTVVTNSYGNLTVNTNKLLYVDMAGLQTTITPLLDSAQAVLDQGQCSPIDSDYADMKSTFCEDIIVSVSAMAMAAFFIGIFLFFMNFSTWFLMYRLEHGPDAPAPIATGNMLYGSGPISPNESQKVHQGVIVSEGNVLAEMTPVTPAGAETFVVHTDGRSEF